MTIDLNHNFTSFVLLDEVDFNFSELKSILEDKFNIKIADENFTKEGVIFSYENMLITLNLIKNLYLITKQNTMQILILCGKMP